MQSGIASAIWYDVYHGDAHRNITSARNMTKLSVSTSHPRGNHGWRFTARMQVASRDEEISLSESNMACSDKQSYTYNSPVGKSWSNTSSKYVCGHHHFLGVFRRLLAIQTVDLAGAAKIKYYKSRRIRQCQQEVQEKSVWLPIFARKFFPWRANCSVRTKFEKFEENTRNSYSNQCFRGLGVV